MRGSQFWYIRTAQLSRSATLWLKRHRFPSWGPNLPFSLALSLFVSVFSGFVSTGFYRDIVKTILDQDKDGRWKTQNLPTTLYNAVAGGHKDILNLLIEHGKLQWKNYNGGCLRTAVEKNNKTAVNFIFGKTFPLPTDDQNKGALDLAKEKREAFKKSWKTNETITANHIVDKLSSIVSRPASIDPRKDEKDQYMSFLDHVRGKSNERAYENAIEDLAKFAHFNTVLLRESDREGESHRERVLSESSLILRDPDSSDTEEDPDCIRSADHQPLQDPPSRQVNWGGFTDTPKKPIIVELVIIII
jgi:hypothetical protein